MIIFTLLFLTVWTLLTLCLLLDISRWCWKIAVAAMTLPNARNATHLSWFWSQSFIQWYSVIHHDTTLTSHYNIIIIHYELWLNIPCFLKLLFKLHKILLENPVPHQKNGPGLLQKVCDVLKTRAELERKYGESLLSLGETIGPEPGRFESEQNSSWNQRFVGCRVLKRLFLKAV